MECILMNKNKEVLRAEYKEDLGVFTEVYEIINIDYAPLIIKNAYQNEQKLTTHLSKWFMGRGIPDLREDLDLLLARVNVSTKIELLDKCFGLSLSDQYWIKPVGEKIEYKDINFFEHDFKYAGFKEATFSNTKFENIEISLNSPNNTTDGRLKKAWIIEDGKRYLLKGGYKSEVMQPFNEVLASKICERLGFEHVEYNIEVLTDKVVSKCECFINSNTEFVTAYQILHGSNNIYDAYEEYINILEENKIDNARKKIENMLILDYLILNEDRHLNNFGIIRNVESLKWLDVAPIFDNGQSLNILDYTDSEVLVNGEGKFFYTNASFDEMLVNIQDISRFDLRKLDGIVEEFEELLLKYRSVTNMTERRINKICKLLSSRIDRLKNIVDKSI